MDGFKLGGRLNRTGFISFFAIIVVMYCIAVWGWDTYMSKYTVKGAMAVQKNRILWEFIMGFEWTVNVYMLYSLAMRRIRDIGKFAIVVDIFFPLYYVAMLCIRNAGNAFLMGGLALLMLILAIPGSDKKINQYGEADKGRSSLQYVVYAGMYLFIIMLDSTLFWVLRAH